ncbi:uncharacterized protein LOC106078465 isoform X1 [Biomphalaria glabrata]|uniref:Uncharacterized protein LOC106078465 isoform X1 n=1 Tax=Biomphalaria glabrata TaxID=6526 RepID=A0A9W3BCV0_BIOGL|nr:uncharacterized protein LOC106078465 isoform X1 [Biomphalaria glabrata]XP_055897266.1 uncharacterized protein LOC106078465 isoform X1 [Biomphalaria glabrata]XP_055897267.1 uncharacterized protein LOC106078465 isoform X1 [Biomphalaria glabrata]
MSRKESQRNTLLEDVESRKSSVSASEADELDTSRVRSYQKLVLLMVVISIVLCAVVLVMAIFSIMQTSEGQLSETVSTKPIACIECKKLIKTPYDLSDEDSLLDSLSREFIEGLEKCCAYNSKQLSSMLELTMRRQDVKTASLSSFNAANFTFSPVSAHKRMYAPTNPYPTVEYIRRVPVFPKETVYVMFKHENRSDDPLREHVRGVEVLKDGLRIIYSGLYYVYSSIHFRPESAYPCRNFTYQTWTHIVERMSPNNPNQSGCLLRTSHTCCDSCSMDDETSYTGGVFYLAAGDVLRVAIGGHGLVYFQTKSSFAGLMMLGTGNTEANLEKYF